jgi:hypothetical protein
MLNYKIEIKKDAINSGLIYFRVLSENEDCKVYESSWYTIDDLRSEYKDEFINELIQALEKYILN